MAVAESALSLQLSGLPMHQLIALLCVSAVVYKLSVLLHKRNVAFHAMAAFPGPPTHWLFGHALEFKNDERDIVKNLKWAQHYPYAFPVWYGPFVCLLKIHHPDYVKTLLTSTEPKDDFVYSLIKPWIGEGLLVSEGQKWIRHRRLLTPGFHYDVLKPYIQLMADSAKTMMDKWERYAKTNESFELSEHVSLMTLDSILKCAFSYNSNCQTVGGSNTYIKAVYQIISLVNLRIRTILYHNDLIFYLSPHGYRYRKARKVAYNVTAEVIRKRKEALKEEKELDRIQAKRNLDFLDILLLAKDENQQSLSDEDIQAEVDTFMFAGHDTTASGVSFIFYCLACHPEHQKMCRDEILEVLGDKDTLGWDDLGKIPYTTMCIKECLRLYPPVPAISRKLSKPMTFFDGRTLPAGRVVGVSVFLCHKNASVWENPDVFDPLRFLPENVSRGHLMHLCLLQLGQETALVRSLP
ncbi:hypothetical protein Q5P01_011507 [Channa striata]|uniref:aromatase n=1 Tax=Channa striata TaxID=64152 RepID=A0AA88MXH3_CHASR|nr:hypothetical protein Q5P01_011507 [Channa striata]